MSEQHLIRQIALLKASKSAYKILTCNKIEKGQSIGGLEPSEIATAEATGDDSVQVFYQTPELF